MTEQIERREAQAHQLGRMEEKIDRALTWMEKHDERHEKIDSRLHDHGKKLYAIFLLGPALAAASGAITWLKGN